jgi:succinate dehydrogenase/fumarate reductase flavoprotein subunit
MYPQELMQKIEGLAATRAEGQDPPTLSEKARSILLRENHPDHQAAAFRHLRVGSSRGTRVAHELADQLEAGSDLNYAGLDLNPAVGTDVLVLGSGGAGLIAALSAASAGAKVIIATKLGVGNSNTIMALGGMQASVADGDSTLRHFADTMLAGKSVAKPSLVRIMAEDGPRIVEWLRQLGVDFDRDDAGNFTTRKAGGLSAPRILSVGDFTGLNILKVLQDEIRSHPNIEVLEFAPAVELTTSKFGDCNGAVLYKLPIKRYLTVSAKAVILATGGSGRLHVQGYPTSNNFGATGDAIAMAYRAGADLVDLDSFQYHPTGLVFPHHMVGMLVSEAVRSHGGQLRNNRGERFIHELETRDLCSSAIINECKQGRGLKTPGGQCGVWLDTPQLEESKGKGFLRKKLPHLYKQMLRSGINISKQPLLIYPTLHYQNGGIVIDEKAETRVSGLFVAGEAAGGIHGHNRSMGNSLLDIFVFGRRAGLAAAKTMYESGGQLTLGHVDRFQRELKSLRISNVARSPALFPEFISNKL